MATDKIESFKSDLQMRDAALRKATEFVVDSALPPITATHEIAEQDFLSFERENTEKNRRLIDGFLAGLPLKLSKEIYSPAFDWSDDITRREFRDLPLDGLSYSFDEGVRKPMVLQNIAWLEGTVSYKYKIGKELSYRQRPENILRPFFILGDRLKSDAEAEILLWPMKAHTGWKWRGFRPPWPSESQNRIIQQPIPAIICTTTKSPYIEFLASRQDGIDVEANEPHNDEKVHANSPGSVVLLPEDISRRQRNRYNKAGISPARQRLLGVEDIEKFGDITFTNQFMERYAVLNHLADLALAFDRVNMLEKEIDNFAVLAENDSNSPQLT